MLSFSSEDLHGDSSRALRVDSYSTARDVWNYVWRLRTGAGPPRGLNFPSNCLRPLVNSLAAPNFQKLLGFARTRKVPILQPGWKSRRSCYGWPIPTPTAPIL